MYKFLLVCCICICGQLQAQQRASEKPLSAFYSPAMQQQINARPNLQNTTSVQQPRASQKPLTAFYTSEMRLRVDAINNQPATLSTQKRASEKPLEIFFTEAMRQSMRGKTNPMRTQPVIKPPLKTN